MKLNNKGFTIVEVLIVLAIAGAILAAILIAVPALQRNSRNTTLKRSATLLVSSIQEVEAANGGVPPTSWNSNVWKYGSGLTYANQVPSSVSSTITVSTITSLPATFAASNIYIYFSALCSNNTATTTGASASNIAVLYTVETGGINGSGCVQG